MKDDLNLAFEQAFKKISTLKTKLPQDVMLKFYAYYKQATFGNHSSANKSTNVISAFKFNAWIQLNGMSQEVAKKAYIKLANTI